MSTSKSDISTKTDMLDATPKYDRWASELRRRIVDGELRPGDRLPPLAEMKALYGLSRTTVEKVHGLLEKDGLIRREPNRGAFVSQPADKKRTGLIGFCGWGYSQNFRTPYGTQLLEGAQKIAMREERSLVLLDPSAAHSWNKVDGVLTSNTYEAEDLPHLSPDTPRVSLFYALPNVNSVSADNYQGGRLATEYLINMGHTRIACLGVLETQLTISRLAGYRDALEAAGIKPQANWIKPFGPVGYPQPDFRGHGKTLMQEWLQEGWEDLNCSALLAQGDLVAIGAMEALQEAGIAIPEEVSIVGFNGTEVCDLVTPRLTSLAVPLRDMGALGMEMLLQLIEGEEGPKRTLLLATHLDERHTVSRR